MQLLKHLIYTIHTYLASQISIEFITQNISSWASGTIQIGSGEVKFITTWALAVFLKILFDFWRRSWIKHFTRWTKKHGRWYGMVCFRILTAELKLKHCEHIKLHRCILKIWASTYPTSLFVLMGGWGKIVKPSIELLRNINTWNNRMNWLAPIFKLA